VISRNEAQCVLAATGPQTESPTVPVDTPPSARVAGPVPHLRKLAFMFGVVATSLALVLIRQLGGLQ
jgi:hypothetical protein